MQYMKTMTSAEFRKGYAKLTEITLVTVNGHTLGVWQPVSDTTEVTVTQPKPGHTHSLHAPIRVAAEATITTD